MAKVISQLPSGGSVPKHNNLLGLNEGDYLHLTQFEKAKLDGIQSGAEVNVNADWNAISGDAQILNKPTEFPPSTHTHTISEVINLQNELNSKENISNKVNTISGNSSTEYPTEKAVVDYVSSQIGADFAKVVYFDNVTPNVASIFDLNNPPLVNDPSLKEDVANLYIGTDASTWVYVTSPAGYVTKTVTSSGSNFYITGTSTDAGSIKTGSITKKGQIVIDSEVVNDSGLTLKKTESSILKTDSLGKVVKATNLQDVEYAPIVHTHTVSQITDFPTFKTIENQSIIGIGNIDLDKNSVGLGNVDNTSDLSKPLSTATINALATKAPISSVHNPVTLGTANGLSLSNQQLSLGLASSGVTGALSGTDWNNFNSKQPALEFTPENVANKATTLTASSTAYPNNNAVISGLATKEPSFTKNTAFNKNFGTTAGTVVEGGTLGSNAYNSTAFLPLSGGTLTGILNIDGVDSPKIFFRQNSSLISLVTNNFGIYGTGSKTDFNTYVYGNNPYGIWTNGVKRVTVGGDGNATFSGTISASPATTANQVVVKSQLDAVAARPYKVYTALLTQSGSNIPAVTVIENTLGATISYSLGGTGFVVATSSTTSFTDPNKVFISISNGNGAGFFSVLRIQTNQVRIVQQNIAGANTDGLLQTANFEIRVYN